MSSAARFLCFAVLFAPLVVVPGLVFPYVTGRAVFFRVVVQLSIVLLLFLVLRRRAHVKWRGDVVLQALLMFLATQLIASVAGEAPLRSIFSDLERMWGVWAWAHVLAYYILLRIFVRPADWPRYLQVALAVGVGVAVFGLFAEATGPRGFSAAAISTVGNPGFLAGFEYFIVGIAALLFVRDGARSRRIIYAAAGAMAITGIIVSQNRSTVLGLVVACAVFVLIRANRRLRLAGFLVAILLIGAVGVVELGSHARLPGVLGRISRTSVAPQVEVRTLHAKVTLEGIREHPLLGVGPENFDLLWSRHFEAINYKVEPDVRSDREHNALLEAVATSGLLGGAAFILIWVALFVSLVRAYRVRAFSLDETAVCAGIYAGFAAYLLFWFVDINTVTPLLAVAAFVSTSGTGNLLAMGERRRWTAGSSVALGFAGILLAVAIYFDGFAPLKLARALMSIAVGNAPIEDALNDAYVAFGSPAPEHSQTILLYSAYMERLAPILPAARRDPYQRGVLDQAFRRGAIEFQRELAREPTNLRLLLLRGRLLFLAAEFYGNPEIYVPAQRDLRAVIAITPARMPPHLMLSTIRLALGDTASALAEARRAVAITPQFGEPHYVLGEALVASDSAQRGAEELKRALALDYLGRGAVFRSAAFRLQEQGSNVASADLITSYLAKKYGPLEMWEVSQPQLRMLESADSAMLLALLIADQRANRADAARVAASALSVAMPGATPKPLSAR